MKHLLGDKPIFRIPVILFFLFFIFSVQAEKPGMDEKERVRHFGRTMMQALFEGDCSLFEDMLSEPFYFLSHGNIPRAQYAEFICDDFRTGMRRHPEESFTFDNYSRSYHFDIYHSSEFAEITGTNGEKINLNEVLSKAPKPFKPGPNDYLFAGGRLKEGAQKPSWLNFGWAYYLIRLHPGGEPEAIGVLD